RADLQPLKAAFRQPLDQRDLGVRRDERLHRLEAIARRDFEDFDLVHVHLRDRPRASDPQRLTRCSLSSFYLTGSNPAARKAASPWPEERTWSSSAACWPRTVAENTPAENIAGLCSGAGNGPTTSTPGTTISSLTCCTASSTSSHAASSPVNPLAMTVAL